MLQLTKMMNCTQPWISLETNPPLFMKSRSVEYKNEKKNFERRKKWKTILIYRLSKKKIQSAFGYRLQKNPLWNQKNLTGLWNYNYFPTIQWRPHLIWPSSHKEIWILVRQVIGPFLPSFVTWMYVDSTGRLCSQKTGLQTYSNFMHTFLTKVVPDNLKACQICKIM